MWILMVILILMLWSIGDDISNISRALTSIEEEVISMRRKM